MNDRLLRVATVQSWVTARAIVALVWIGMRLADVGERVDQGLFAWDGGWYRQIATDGYRVGGEEVRFFPGYPYLGRFAGAGVFEPVALVVIANMAALVAAWLLGRYALMLTGDTRVSVASVWFFTLWPSAFVLVWAYAESLFLVAAIGTASALLQRHWWWAAAFGTLAGTVRPTAVALCAMALVTVVVDRAGRTGNRTARAAAVVGPLIGLAAVAAWSSRFGSWRAAIDVQGELRGDSDSPITRLWHAVVDLAGRDVLDGLHLIAAIAALVLLAVLIRQRWWSALAYSVVVVYLAVAAENWNSIERYLLNAFPLVVAAAAISVPGRRYRPLVALSAVLMAASTMLAWSGHYVP